MVAQGRDQSGEDGKLVVIRPAESDGVCVNEYAEFVIHNVLSLTEGAGEVLEIRIEVHCF